MSMELSMRPSRRVAARNGHETIGDIRRNAQASITLSSRTTESSSSPGTFEAFNGVAAPGIASLNSNGSRFESLGRIASRQKFDTFISRTVLARQPDGSFLLSGPYTLPGQTELPSLHPHQQLRRSADYRKPSHCQYLSGLSFHLSYRRQWTADELQRHKVYRLG